MVKLFLSQFRVIFESILILKFLSQFLSQVLFNADGTAKELMQHVSDTEDLHKAFECLSTGVCPLPSGE